MASAFAPAKLYVGGKTVCMTLVLSAARGLLHMSCMTFTLVLSASWPTAHVICSYAVAHVIDVSTPMQLHMSCMTLARSLHCEEVQVKVLLVLHDLSSPMQFSLSCNLQQ